ncbi:class I SAM-dependent methyltransferase [Gloeobacter violaceus]|nr:class I SAM-dependent methyltransferase [Gloeobacter violaceus]
MIEQIALAIRDAQSEGPLLQAGKDVLTGFSGDKLVGALQRLALLFERDSAGCYLEVGVFQGLTLLSVASACRSLQCYGIDNFAFFDPEGQNLRIVRERAAKLAVGNATVINKDYEDALESLAQTTGGRKVGVYFVDGPHDYRSQLMCLELVLPHLHRDAVIVVDDSNYRHVRQANRDFLMTHPEFKLVFDAYTACHPANATPAQRRAAQEGWWNGVNILVRDPEGLLPPAYPPTERSRQLYENEHIVHAGAVAELAPQATELLQLLLRNPLRFVASSLRLYQRLHANRTALASRYPQMNTYSADLPASRFNTAVLAPESRTRPNK